MRRERDRHVRSDKEEREREVHMQPSVIAHIFTFTHHHTAALLKFPQSPISGVFTFCRVGELLSDSMSKTRTVDPLFLRAYENLSKAAQRNLSDTGLLEPTVLVCYLDDPDTGIDELAREPGNEAKLQELLHQARRAAGGRRAEFARRGLDEFVRQDKARKVVARSHEAQGPTKLQWAVEAPPPRHSRRLPSRLARSTKLEGDSKAKEKAEEDETQRWVSEVTDLLITLSLGLTRQTVQPRLQTPSSQRRACAQKSEQQQCAAMCGHGGLCGGGGRGLETKVSHQTQKRS